MFCKNCGKEINPGAAICVSCGVAKGVGTNYCANCGQTVTPGAAVCMSCGFAINPSAPEAARKSKTTAALLAFFLGAFGAHNWYLGNTGKAIGQIVLSLFCGVGYIWSVIEGILILTGSINTDANGVPLQ